jgi:hypothetical protein
MNNGGQNFGGGQNRGGESNGGPNSNGPNDGGGQFYDGQYNSGPNGGGGQPGRNPTPSVSTAPVERTFEPLAPDPEVALTLNDARENFRTIVEAYVLRESDGGTWAYKDAGGKTAKLALVRVDLESVDKVAAKRYAGLVLLRDVRARRIRKLRFTVDFSGTDWKVVSIAEPKAAKPSAARAPR